MHHVTEKKKKMVPLSKLAAILRQAELKRTFWFKIFLLVFSPKIDRSEN